MLSAPGTIVLWLVLDYLTLSLGRWGEEHRMGDGGAKACAALPSTCTLAVCTYQRELTDSEYLLLARNRGQAPCMH